MDGSGDVRFHFGDTHVLNGKLSPKRYRLDRDPRWEKRETTHSATLSPPE